MTLNSSVARAQSLTWKKYTQPKSQFNSQLDAYSSYVPL